MNDQEGSNGGVCVYTPDRLVRVLMRGICNVLENVDTTDDVQTLLYKARTGNFEHILIHADFLPRATLASLVVKIRNRNAKLNIYLLQSPVGPDRHRIHPNLHRIHPVSVEGEYPITVLPDFNFEGIIDAIRSGIGNPTPPSVKPGVRLTKSQWEVLEYVSRGLSNVEIARFRNCTTRAVEAILSRTMQRIGIEKLLSRRSKTVAVLNFLEGLT